MSGQDSKLFPKVLAVFVTLLVFAALVFAFLLVGSPSAARMQRADAKRSEALSAIADAVRQEAASGHDAKTLDEITLQGWYGSDIKKDPETGKPYEYQRIDHDHFTLCATFDSDVSPAGAQGEDYMPVESPFDKHTKGKNCFHLTVK